MSKFLAVLFCAAAPAFALPATVCETPLIVKDVSLEKLLDRAIDGKLPLEAVSLSVGGWGKTGPAQVDVFGRGIGILDRKTQFRLGRDEVLAILKAFRGHGFTKMPDRFGEDSEKDAPTATALVTLTIAGASKSVVQMRDAERSKELGELVNDVFAVCDKPAKQGVGASDLSDGLKKVADGVLAPETFALSFVRVDHLTGAREQRVLKLHGRSAEVSRLPGMGSSSCRLTPDAFAGLVKSIIADGAAALRKNLYSDEYVDLRLGVLNYEVDVQAQAFARMTPTTYAEEQRTFARVCTNLDALRDAIAPPPTPAK